MAAIQPVGTRAYRLAYTAQRYGKTSLAGIAEKLQVQVGTVEEYVAELKRSGAIKPETGAAGGAGAPPEDPPVNLNLADFGGEPERNHGWLGWQLEDALWYKDDLHTSGRSTEGLVSLVRYCWVNHLMDALTARQCLNVLRSSAQLEDREPLPLDEMTGAYTLDDGDLLTTVRADSPEDAIYKVYGVDPVAHTAHDGNWWAYGVTTGRDTDHRFGYTEVDVTQYA